LIDTESDEVKLVQLAGLNVGVATVAVVVLWNQSKDAVTATALLGVAL
jgi:hypothetical protein